MPPFADVTAFVAKHKAVAIAGAAGAVVLGLRNRSQNKAAGVAGTTAGAATAQLAPTGVYDSTSSDLYNSIQPEIDALASGQSKLSDVLSALTIANKGGSSGPLGGFVAGVGAAHGTDLQNLAASGAIPANTIPVYGAAGSPQGLAPIRTLAFGSTITPTGNAVVGPWAGGGQATFYPIAGGGFVSAADIAARSV